MTKLDLPLHAVTKPQTHPRQNGFVGYIRVSTRRQEDQGDSLTAQLDQITAYASAKNSPLFSVYQDAASAFGSGSRERVGLKAAINQALQLNVPILVSSIDRLSRSLKDLRLIERKGLSIHSADRGKVSLPTLKGFIAAAEAESAAKATRAAEQHRSTAKKKRRLPDNFAESQRKGAISNCLRSEQRAREVADFLLKNPRAGNMTHQALAEAMNKTGPLNLKSAKNNVRGPWTKEALRPVRKKAEQLLVAEEEMDREDMLKTAVGVIVQGDVHSDPLAVPTAQVKNDNAPQHDRVDQIRQILKEDTSERRCPTADEFNLLKEIMDEKGLTKSGVMDEMGFNRLNASLWNAKSKKTMVAPAVLQRLHELFRRRLPR
jgi:DNA invertase Pin-like site-specific DNA recombinase